MMLEVVAGSLRFGLTYCIGCLDQRGHHKTERTYEKSTHSKNSSHQPFCSLTQGRTRMVVATGSKCICNRTLVQVRLLIF
jgi:hypothetical protein